MANGTVEKSLDSEDFVLRSGARSGLKREFAFALRIQSELAGSLGRTRAQKTQNNSSSLSSNGDMANSSNKRFKKADDFKVQPNIDDSDAKSPILIDDSDGDKQSDRPEKVVPRRYTRSASKGNLHPLIGKSESPIVVSETPTANGKSESPIAVSETPTAIDGGVLVRADTEMLNDVETAINGADPVRADSAMQNGVENDLARPSSEVENVIASPEKVITRRYTRSVSKGSPVPMGSEAESLVEVVKTVTAIDGILDPIREARYTRLVSKGNPVPVASEAESLVVVEVVKTATAIDGIVDPIRSASQVENGISNDLLRSVSDVVGSGVEPVIACTPEKIITKRYTRSVSKGNLVREVESPVDVVKTATTIDGIDPIRAASQVQNGVGSDLARPVNDAVASTVETVIPRPEKIITKTYTRLVLKSNLEPLVGRAELPIEVLETSAVDDRCDPIRADSELLNGAENNLAGPLSEVVESGTETFMVIDGGDGVGTDVLLQNCLQASTPRRFTRSLLKSNVESFDKEGNQRGDLNVPPPSGFDRSRANGEVQKGVKSELENDLVTHTSEVVGSGVETLIKTEGSDGVRKDIANTPRRFTRSLLKGNSETSENSTVTPGNNGVSALSATPTKKLELKMSKKISLSKFPSNVKELFATGLLEGLPVKYVFRGQQQRGLRGVIKDGGILCSCTACNWCNVISAIQFEQHAGSLKKRAPENIYLENGNTIRDVLVSCRNSPLDMLEMTIQSAIGYMPVEKTSVCQHCKESFSTSCVGASILCNKCRESKQTQAIPARRSDSRARSPKPILIQKSSEKTSKHMSPQLTRKDLRLHKLVFSEEGLPDGTEVAYYARGQRLLEGYKTGIGIFCRCCNSEVSPSQFEAHAGWASRRKPYLHIFTSNGVSLHELSVSLSKGRKFSANDNDDLCTICADGGDLLLCDGCPRAFHTECVGLSGIPRGDWYCSYCQNMYQREQCVERNANAMAAGRVLGVDPIEQISMRCIRIVKTTETDVSACVLCRRHDFSKSGFGPRTVLLCDQCEKEFHVGCLKDHKMGNLKELPKGKWFCCADCCRIHASLQKLVVRGSESLPNSLSDVIKRKQEEKSPTSNPDLDIRWRLISGKIATPDSRLMLSKAVSIFHDRFDPIVDSTTGRDLIPPMVYGRNIRDQEFGGMYCAVLTANSSVVSAGILRIFGQGVAELPLVATSNENQGQGYFQSLFSCIERLLGFLKVKHLVLPAADEAESIWTKKFGFSKITKDQLCDLARDAHVMTFQGTTMLHKPVPKCRVVGKSA